MSTPERGQPGHWSYLAFWDNGAMALETTKHALPVNETQAAELLKAEHGQDWLHYAVGSDTWFTWTGQCHEPDTRGSVGRIVMGLGWRLIDVLNTARQLEAQRVNARMPDGSTEAAEEQARKQAWADWKAAETFAWSLMKAAGQNALLTVLARVCACADEDIDERNQGLLNMANGTLDLASLELRPHRREDMITYALPDEWAVNAQCPRFLSLVHQVCGWDNEVAWYLLKLLGYSLLGDNREQKIIFIAGPSGSGKSVLLYVVSQVLGALAHASGAELITVVHQGRNARKENSVRGKRLVTITETSKFMTIDEGQLKRITGEPVISVDRHYAKTELKTNVTWTIWVATNDMPNLVNFDAAMKRRIIVIPGGPGLREDQMDPKLADKILGNEHERQGIIALLAKGCREYHRSGHLAMPLEVQMMTEAYAAEQNTVTQFLADTMVINGYGPGIPQHDAWLGYSQWAKGGPSLGRTKFFEYLKAQPGVKYSSSSRRFENLAWNPDWAAKVG